MSVTQPVGATPPPPRPAGSVLDSSNPLATNLVGLFIMNEGSGTTDLNLVDGQVANFSGSSSPSWNTSDPSVVFNGGGSLNSYMNAGTDLAFDKLTTSQTTIVAKVYVTALATGGVCEKNDDNAADSGFLFGWDSSGTLSLHLGRHGGTGVCRSPLRQRRRTIKSELFQRQRQSRIRERDESAVPHRERQLRHSRLTQRQAGVFGCLQRTDSVAAGDLPTRHTASYPLDGEWPLGLGQAGGFRRRSEC